MPTVVHFIDVGQGNMTMLQLADGTVMLYDCNITDDNEYRVLQYLGKVLPKRTIDIFVNSHRDADHMRGVKRIHHRFPFRKVWDSDVEGGTPGSSEYRAYMELRREVGYEVVKARTYFDFGRTRIRIMNSKNDDLPDDPNAQSIVMKVQQHDAQTGVVQDSLMLTGDSDAQSWKHSVLRVYGKDEVRSTILLGSHHGSISFFDDPADERNYYTEHLRSMAPQMTVISVGPNIHGHPDPKALELYDRYTSGSRQGNKIFSTNKHGTIKLELKDQGGWIMSPNQ